MSLSAAPLVPTRSVPTPKLRQALEVRSFPEPLYGQVSTPPLVEPLAPHAGLRPVLVLEDDAAVAATICLALARDGWTTVTASTLAEGRLRLHRDNPRLVIADLGLPDGNGIAFVREAAACADLGIIVVSGRAEEVDRVIGLEVGADDYLTKPFSLREMVARIRALSRRLDAVAAPAQGEPAPAALDVPPPVAEPARWNLAGLCIQPSRCRIQAADGSETRLTSGEAGLLNLLLTEPENLADRETISRRVLGRRLLPEQRGVDQLASNLRQKLVTASAGQITITALRGRGYRLVW
ncbi:response regulator transcription factor [Roseomonas frigidaquae]|uniref:Response regulator transcription factor n=1 Tax=Falsiroseomonas frigidaquae TaxID=487318 RepID=A0ABX1F7U6_9PROT|nr:response regulator transcription factor [Falsiroseomonas frigidaquae]NKE48417.1 response regulator transcription factor [Falsiroseomonas frigidaquae]